VLYPLTFIPIFKERVWGGRNLERLYGKALPPRVPIGESWEISDRPEGISQIANGHWVGKDLRWVMENHADELLGRAPAVGGRFPLLVKILDAQERLSLQVHPPADRAASLGGEPKTEMWFVAHATASAELYVGLRRGSTRAEFERRLEEGTVAECFHRHRVQAGDAMFLPGGRVHAIGSGNVIFEIQQNSDTTYRVFDWNRMGLDGKPRELHLAQSLASINFNDHEPALIQTRAEPRRPVWRQRLVRDPLFAVDVWGLAEGSGTTIACPAVVVLGVVAGVLRIEYAQGTVDLGAGRFCVLPASLRSVVVRALARTQFLEARAGGLRLPSD
jgi:mannose-6-phosphate isomerase